MDDYFSDYDNADQMEHIAGGIRYMPIKKESVGKPDYQPLQQQNKGGKHLKQVQRNQKRIIVAIVTLGLLLVFVIVAGTTLFSISWSRSKVKAKDTSESNFFQNCKQETTSCTLSNWLIFILPNCTTKSVTLHMKVDHNIVT